VPVFLPIFIIDRKSDATQRGKLSPDKIDRKRAGLAVLSGLLLTGSFPDADLSWLAWFALVPLLYGLKNLSPGNAFRIGFITGSVHYLSLMYWLVPTMQTYGGLPVYVSVPVLFLLAAYLGLYIALFSLLSGLCLRRPVRLLVFLPVIWVSCEYLRSVLFTGLPWGLLGHTQYRHLPIVQLSDVLGVYGISYLLLQANAVCYAAIRWLADKSGNDPVFRKSHIIGSVAGMTVALALTICYGVHRIHEVDHMISRAPAPTISVIQGNIDQAAKWNPAFQAATVHKYIALSRKALPSDPALVVWPETAAPFYFGHHPRLTKTVEKGIRGIGKGFLLGSPSFSRKPDRVEYYNSAFLVDETGSIAGRYDKAHLVPFGEYVPFKRWLPFLGKIVAHVGDFTAGEEGKTMSWLEHRMGVLICYEILFPGLSRQMTKNRAGYLVNMTNDAWYGRTSAPYQHFSVAVFRAVENRRSLIRSANTGISGFIDPAGRIAAASGIFEDSVISHRVPVLKTATPYTRFGDWFAWACLAASLIRIGWSVVSRQWSVEKPAD